MSACTVFKLRIAAHRSRMNSAYPPRACLPQGCLFALRVWLRAGDIDHRLFSEDALWIGKDPDFYSIQDATFARLRSVNSQTLLYKIVVGRALMDFTIRHVIYLALPVDFILNPPYQMATSPRGCLQSESRIRRLRSWTCVIQ